MEGIANASSNGMVPCKESTEDFRYFIAMELDLLEAAAIGDTDRISKLIASGVNVNYKHQVNGW